jgi:SAM-dependent methyltransferase
VALVSDTYADVDASAEPAAAAGWQQCIATWPGIDAYKRRTRELLRDAERVLDVGCGPGDDVLALGAQRCVGVDRSAVMCARARERGATVVQAAAEVLPFRDSTFSGVRSDRTLQHVDDPVVALQELLRVVQPGAPVVVADPDQESLVIQVPGVRRSVLDRLKALRRDLGYRNGRWISTAPSILEQLGAEVTSIEPFPLIIRDPAKAFGLPTWPVHWREAGGFTEEELAEWNRGIADPSTGFLYSLTFLVVTGRK